MKVKDIISCMVVDSYRYITVEKIDTTTNLVEKRYVIPPHSCDCTNITEDVWEAEVAQMVNYYDGLAIIITDTETR